MNDSEVLQRSTGHGSGPSTTLEARRPDNSRSVHYLGLFRHRTTGERLQDSPSTNVRVFHQQIHRSIGLISDHGVDRLARHSTTRQRTPLKTPCDSDAAETLIVQSAQSQRCFTCNKCDVKMKNVEVMMLLWLRQLFGVRSNESMERPGEQTNCRHRVAPRRSVPLR